MALTDRDIALFARDSVAADSLAAEDEAARHRRLIQAQRVARSFQAAAEAAVRASGYRLTQRVRDGLWTELCRIEASAGAAKAGRGSATEQDVNDPV